MTDLPTDGQLITLAALCVGIAFLAGMLTYAMIRDAMDRKALRDAAADAFMDYHFGKDAR